MCACGPVLSGGSVAQKRLSIPVDSSAEGPGTTPQRSGAPEGGVEVWRCGGVEMIELLGGVATGNDGTQRSSSSGRRTPCPPRLSARVEIMVVFTSL